MTLSKSHDGWKVISPNGIVTLARFRGYGAHRRALAYIEACQPHERRLRRRGRAML